MPEANIGHFCCRKICSTHSNESLKSGLHVMIFSDNVVSKTTKTEAYAAPRFTCYGSPIVEQLLSMVAIGFWQMLWNARISVLSSFGTGLQEICCIISNEVLEFLRQLVRVSWCKKEIGGIMFLQALQALNEDKETEVIVLVQNHLHGRCAEKIASETRKLKNLFLQYLLVKRWSY